MRGVRIETISTVLCSENIVLTVNILRRNKDWRNPQSVKRVPTAVTIPRYNVIIEYYTRRTRDDFRRGQIEETFIFPLEIPWPKRAHIIFIVIITLHLYRSMENTGYNGVIRE